MIEILSTIVDLLDEIYYHIHDPEEIRKRIRMIKDELDDLYNLFDEFNGDDSINDLTDQLRLLTTDGMIHNTLNIIDQRFNKLTDGYKFSHRCVL